MQQKMSVSSSRKSLAAEEQLLGSLKTCELVKRIMFVAPRMHVAKYRRKLSDHFQQYEIASTNKQPYE